MFRTAFVGELINIQKDGKEDADKDEQESQATEHENQTQNSIMKKFLNLPAKGWKERDEYREGIMTKKKNPFKEYSIMKLHSKRLNVLEECRAMQMLTMLKRDGKKGSIEKSSNFAASVYGKTASDFFTPDKFATYCLRNEQEQTGDRQLFESEHKRAYNSRVNWIHLILAPFLIFCSGICA